MTRSGPLTVLHLTHEGRGAGSTISIALLARAQAQAGHRVLVGCPDGAMLADMTRTAGMTHVPLDFDALGSAAAAVAGTAAREAVSVVNAHSSRDRASCRIARLTGRLAAALVMTRRAMPRSTPLSVLPDSLLADATIAVSTQVAQALVRRGFPKGRVSVVHNAVDLSRIDDPPDAASVERARTVIGANGARPVLGVVSRRKDHELLLRSLQWLERPVTLACLGTEPDATLSRLAAAASRHHVVFLPFQADVRPFYALFDIAVLPSHGEGLSQSLLEAMALGKPVVATAAGGNLDLVRDGEDGLLVPRHRPRELAAAVRRLLDDRREAERMGGAARQRVRSTFTIERTLAATEAVYRAALSGRVA